MLVGHWSNEEIQGLWGLAPGKFWGPRPQAHWKMYLFKTEYSFFQKLEIQKLRGLFLFPVERLYGNTKKTQSQEIMRRIYPVWATGNALRLFHYFAKISKQRISLLCIKVEVNQCYFETCQLPHVYSVRQRK